MFDSFRRLLTFGLSLPCLLTIGLLNEIVYPQPAISADEIRVVVTGPLVLSISVDALERFAETGEATGDFALVTRFLDDAILDNLQQGLTRPIPFDLLTVNTLAYSPLGQDAIYNVGQVIRVHPEVNGFHGLRAAVIGAAAQADGNGWTMLDVLRQFPSQTIDVKLEDLLELRHALTVYFSYNQAVVEAIQQQAEAEAMSAGFADGQPTLDAAGLADLSQPGDYSVFKEEIIVENPAIRQTVTGLTVNYDFPVDVYFPQGLDAPAPIVIISHGFGDVKESFTFIAEHLASHGFVAILPDHVGSDLGYRQEFLEGRLNTLLSPMEFLNRPQEISFLIDELERLVNHSPEWSARLDLNRIGVMGDSLGGSTVLALAGAEINYARLAAACDEDTIILNFALYLECRARFLPPENYQLRDERIKAVLAMHPLGGFLYGPEGMSQIDIPLLMISGSNDIVSPVVSEQVHPFIWIPSNPKYLALLQIGTHFTSKPGRDGADGIFRLLTGEYRDIGTRYAKSLTIAFWQAYLNNDANYLPYLTANYGRAVSTDQPLRLDIIQSLTAEQLEGSYGRTPPIPVIPPAIASLPPVRNEPILAEIERTGVLKVAFRKDAPPFGYINQASEWDGYCGEVAIALSNYLKETLNIPVEVELVELTSTLQNRFDLVRNGSVHLECGPNTIRPDIEGITFSQSILTVGTRLLIPRDTADRINPNLPLDDVRLGVLQDTTTETFVRHRYPQASIVPFIGPNARQEAVQAVVSGQIDAFAGDDILSVAELLREGLDASNFALVPELPLTCEFYGFILPSNDPSWKETIDQFIASDDEDAVFESWFETLVPFNVEMTNYCVNQVALLN